MPFLFQCTFETFMVAMKELSVVIPVMNEEDNIQSLLQAVKDALLDIDYEVILVDDGSWDNTKLKK